MEASGLSCLSFSLLCPSLTPSGEVGKQNSGCDNQNDPRYDPGYPARQMFYLSEVAQSAPGKEAQATKDDRPQDTTGCIIDKEGAPVHVVDTSQKCSPCT